MENAMLLHFLTFPKKLTKICSHKSFMLPKNFTFAHKIVFSCNILAFPKKFWLICKTIALLCKSAAVPQETLLSLAKMLSRKSFDLPQKFAFALKKLQKILQNFCNPQEICISAQKVIIQKFCAPQKICVILQNICAPPKIHICSQKCISQNFCAPQEISISLQKNVILQTFCALQEIFIRSQKCVTSQVFYSPRNLHLFAKIYLAKLLCSPRNLHSHAKILSIKSFVIPKKFSFAHKMFCKKCCAPQEIAFTSKIISQNFCTRCQKCYFAKILCSPRSLHSLTKMFSRKSFVLSKKFAFACK